MASAWRRYTLICALATALLILVAAPFFALVAPALPASDTSLVAVSGYYGPGSVAAWLLLVVSNTEYVFYGRHLLKCAWWDKKLHVPDQGLNSSLLGTAAYSLVTFGDLLFQVIKWTQEPESVRKLRNRRGITFRPKGGLADLYERIQAQVAVIYLTFAISSIALIPHFVYLGSETWANANDELLPKTFIRRRRRRRTRLAVWAVMLTISQLVMAAFSREIISSTFSWWQSAVCSLATYIVVLGLFITNLEPWRWVYAGPAVIGCFMVLFIPEFSVDSGRIYPGRFAWPQSSAKLSDLDQAATLGVAMAVVGVSSVKAVLRQREAQNDAAEATTNDNEELTHLAASTAVSQIGDQIPDDGVETETDVADAEFSERQALICDA